MSFVAMLLSPVFLLAALVVKLTSPGSSFFVQERVGLNKRRFRLYKFRTMVANAPERQWEVEHLNEVVGPVFKIKKDPRLTPVGKFLGKTSIDELPQLFNVLKGDMSLVGPRPLPLRDYQGFQGTGSAAASASARASPAYGRSTAAAPSPSNNGWSWICSTSITGPSGSTSRFWPRPFPPLCGVPHDLKKDGTRPGR